MEKFNFVLLTCPSLIYLIHGVSWLYNLYMTTNNRQISFKIINIYKTPFWYISAIAMVNKLRHVIKMCKSFLYCFGSVISHYQLYKRFITFDLKFFIFMHLNNCRTDRQTKKTDCSFVGRVFVWGHVYLNRLASPWNVYFLILKCLSYAESNITL